MSSKRHTPMSGTCSCRSSTTAVSPTRWGRWPTSGIPSSSSPPISAPPRTRAPASALRPARDAFSQEQVLPGGFAEFPARVRQPARQGHRLPAADARSHAQHPAQGTGARARTPWLQNREWAVEWESSALEFLLEKGFTADMGARPLKRAIDQFLLAPLAATMVERRFPTGDQFLFVRSDGEAHPGGVRRSEFGTRGTRSGRPARPHACGLPAPAVEALASAVLQPTGLRTEREQLLGDAARASKSQLAGAEWENLRDELGGADVRWPNSGTATIAIACSRDSHSWTA